MSVHIDPGAHLCMVCGRVVDWWMEPDGSNGHWRHSLQDTWDGDTDHPLIPVRQDLAPEQVRPRCDFCSADQVTWFLPVRPFEHMAGVSMDDWAACDLCAAEIQKNAWGALLRRAIVSYEAIVKETIEPLVEMSLKDMHRRLRKNITGPVQRMKEDA